MQCANETRQPFFRIQITYTKASASINYSFAMKSKFTFGVYSMRKENYSIDISRQFEIVARNPSYKKYRIQMVTLFILSSIRLVRINKSHYYNWKKKTE